MIKVSLFLFPLPFQYSNNDRYHYYLNFLIEALELLPLKVDWLLMLVACFRVVKLRKNPPRQKAHEVLSEFCVNYLGTEAQLYTDGVILISELLSFTSRPDFVNIWGSKIAQ